MVIVSFGKRNRTNEETTSNFMASSSFIQPTSGLAGLSPVVGLSAIVFSGFFWVRRHICRTLFHIFFRQ